MSTTATGTELGADLPERRDVAGEELPPGIGPYALAWRRLRRNKVALAFGALFLLIVILCLLAPVYAHDIAHTGPNDQHVDTALDQFGLPIGPTWHAKFFLGADNTGRDVAVRLLYGGRNSLQIGFEATLITMLLATVFGILAGYFRGATDGIISRAFEVIWAFPVYLLGISLGVVLAISGLDLGFIHISGSSLLITALIIGLIYTPVRGQVDPRSGARPARTRVHRRLRASRDWATSGSCSRRSSPTCPRRSSCSSRWSWPTRS